MGRRAMTSPPSTPRAPTSRRGSVALALLGVALALVGLTALYVRHELANRDRFADRSVEALRSKPVQTVIAEEVAVELIERGSPDVVASRPLVLTAVQAILETEEFERILRRSAASAHDLLFHGDRDVVVELQTAREALLPAIRSVSPEVARQIPADFAPRIAQIERSDAATSAVRVADAASAAALPLLIAGLAALAGALWVAPDRRRAVLMAALCLIGGAGTGLIAMALLRLQVVSRADQVGVISEDDAQAAAGAVWDAFAGDLERWFEILAFAGIATAGAALLAAARLDRASALRRAAEAVAGVRLPRGVRVLRGVALALLGALVLLRIEPVFAGVVAIVGALLVLLGLAELLSTAGRPAATARRPRHRRVRPAVVAAAGAALAAVVVVAVAVVPGGGPATPPRKGEITECNGLRVLCDRRLDQVVLPGTHNAMSAANRPGWFFANQTRPVPRQLRDGIRLLMLDPHYGVVDARGRVRTDLRAEGTNRNRVARRLGLAGVDAAERLAGRLGLVPTEGKREVFLCHTLCELGADRMSSTLDELRGFLERNRSEVVVLLLESSVAPRDVQAEFEHADLEPYLATLDRDRPLPTLREMIASGRRLVVFDQGDGGPAPWYQPGFVYIQDTRIDSLLESPIACKPGRGTPESPLFVINHWVDSFPPSPSRARQVGDRRTLLRRVRRCRATLGRVPNAIAVDFYDRTDVVAVARRLNLEGAG